MYSLESEIDTKKKKIAQTKKYLAREGEGAGAKTQEVGRNCTETGGRERVGEDPREHGDGRRRKVDRAGKKQVDKIKNIAESKESENKEMTLRMAQLENELDKV